LDATQETALHLLARKLNLHHRLADDDQLAIVVLPHKIRRLEALSYILRESDRPDRCAVLIDGYAFRHKLTGDGSRQILSINIPGEALDFQNLFLEEADHNIQMLSRGVIADIPREAIEALILAHPEVGRAILITALVEASIFREWVVNIGQRDSRSRIAHLLCEFAYRLNTQDLGVDDAYQLPITQEQLADATGLTPVHVNRVLQALQREGLIERERRMIRFPSWERMQDVADFNPRYLHTLEAGINMHQANGPV
jgi:CRP-like cAMP-binding protein